MAECKEWNSPTRIFIITIRCWVTRRMPGIPLQIEYKTQQHWGDISSWSTFLNNDSFRVFIGGDDGWGTFQKD